MFVRAESLVLVMGQPLEILGECRRRTVDCVISQKYTPHMADKQIVDLSRIHLLYKWMHKTCLGHSNRVGDCLQILSNLETL